VEKEKGILEYIDVVRWQDGKIYVLGRSEEKDTSDGHSFRARHIIHNALTCEMISEDSFIHKGNFPLFMCGCYTLSCEGDCPPLLDHELALNIHENRIKTDKYNDNIRKFKEANLMNLEKYQKDLIL
jgi:hypothetical protein